MAARSTSVFCLLFWLCGWHQWVVQVRGVKISRLGNRWSVSGLLPFIFYRRKSLWPRYKKCPFKWTEAIKKKGGGHWEKLEYKDVQKCFCHIQNGPDQMFLFFVFFSCKHQHQQWASHQLWRTGLLSVRSIVASFLPLLLLLLLLPSGAAWRNSMPNSVRASGLLNPCLSYCSTLVYRCVLKPQTVLSTLWWAHKTANWLRSHCMTRHEAVILGY